jgi:hypothetical protein
MVAADPVAMSLRPRHALLAAATALLLAAPACGNGGTGGTHTTSAPGGAGGAGGTGTTSSTSSGPCTEAWACSPWESVDGLDGGAPADAGTDGGAPDAGPSFDAARTCVDQSQCGTVVNKPIEAANLPALDFDYFRCNVEPILDRKCALLGCHGTEQGRALRVYARARKRLAGQLLENPACGPGATPSDGCDGADACLCAAPLTDAELHRNHDAARGFAMDGQGKPLLPTKLDKSQLLALPVVGSKLAHGGVQLFVKDDADYSTLKNWLGGAQLGAPCN